MRTTQSRFDRSPPWRIGGLGGRIDHGDTSIVHTVLRFAKCFHQFYCVSMVKLIQWLMHMHMVYRDFSNINYISVPEMLDELG
jgi:thiamine pyrophosphokinase